MQSVPFSKVSLFIRYDPLLPSPRVISNTNSAENRFDVTITHSHNSTNILIDELFANPTVEVAKSTLSRLRNCELQLTDQMYNPNLPPVVDSHVDRHIESCCRSHDTVKELALSVLKTHLKEIIRDPATPLISELTALVKKTSTPPSPLKKQTSPSTSSEGTSSSSPPLVETPSKSVHFQEVPSETVNPYPSIL